MKTDNQTKTVPITIYHCIPKGTKDSSENALYRPRRPQDSSYYHCVEDHFETFERMKNALSGPMGFIVPISGPSSTAIWTVGFYVMVSPGSDVGSAAMNIYLPSPASADTSALPATKSEWSSLANGCAERF